MDTPASATDKPHLKEPPDFSLVLGGPLYQMLLRARLSGDMLSLLRRRIAVISTLAWAPLLLLSAAQGLALGDGVVMPFLFDFETHIRLLVALPLLIIAERVVNQRMRPLVRQFVERGLIPDAARPRFDAAIESAMRLRNSMAAELSMIAFVYIVGVGFIWRTQIAMDVTSWYGVDVGGKLQPSMAGWWLGCFSLPLFQFILLRWYYRLFIWTRFLWQVSRIELDLMPMHPDRCGGLGFAGVIGQAFAPVLLAQGSLLAGIIANQVFYKGAKLPEFKIDLIGGATIMVFAVLGPLLVFAPQLAAARRKGLREYGILAQRYAREFDRKWLRGGAGEGDSLIGSADIQSLADMGASFDVVREMKLAPFTIKNVVHLAVTTLLPVAPLLLTVVPLEELLDHIVKAVF